MSHIFLLMDSLLVFFQKKNAGTARGAKTRKEFTSTSPKRSWAFGASSCSVLPELAMAIENFAFHNWNENNKCDRCFFFFFFRTLLQVRMYPKLQFGQLNNFTTNIVNIMFTPEICVERHKVSTSSTSTDPGRLLFIQLAIRFQEFLH